MPPLIVSAHGDLHLRIVELTRQIEAATNNPAPLYLQRGELQREHLEWEAALADFAKAAELDPKLPGIELGRGKLLADAGKLEEAKAMLDKAVARYPEDGEAYVARGRVLLKQEQRAAAIADYERGIGLLKVPAPEYVLEAAQAKVAAQDLTGAIRIIDQGLTKLGLIPKLQAFAVDLEISLKNYANAVRRLDTIIKEVQRKESWYAMRAEALLAAGQPGEAAKSYQLSLASIKALPPRLQQSPSMLKLQTNVNEALTRLSHPPETAGSGARAPAASN